MAEVFQLGPSFKGLDLQNDPDATDGAREAMNTRRDRARLEGLNPPAPVADAHARLRGLAWHRKVTGDLSRLDLTEDDARVDGVRLETETGAAYVPGGTELIRPVQNGDMTVWCDGVDHMRYWHERDVTDPPVAWPLTLPATPTGITGIATELTSNVINSIDQGTHGAAVTTVTGWSTVPDPITGHFDSIEWNTDGFTHTAVRMNSDTGMVQNDGVLFAPGGDPFDWDEMNKLTLEVRSGGESRVGKFLSFVVGKTSPAPAVPDADETAFPFTIQAAGVTNYVPIDLRDPSVPRAALQGLTYYGIRVLSPDGQFVVSFTNLKEQSGLTGKQLYVFTDVAEQGEDANGDPILTLASPEGPRDNDGVVTPVEVECGTKGSKVDFTFSPAVPAGHTRKAWRMEAGVATVPHYVADIAAGATSWSDTEDDVSANPTLVEVRNQIPAGLVNIGTHRGGLTGWKDGYQWYSNVFDVTTWRDLTPEQAIQLGDLLSNADRCKLPCGEYGKVVASATMGVATGADFRRDSLLMTDDGWDLIVTGDSYKDLGFSDVRKGGCAGPYAWWRDKDRRVVRVDTEGDVTAVDPNTGVVPLSDTLRDTLRSLTGKAAWSGGLDPVTSRMVLFAGSRYFSLDLIAGGWDEMDPSDYGTVLVCAPCGDGEGGYLTAGRADGTIVRVFDPAGAPLGWRYRTARMHGGSMTLAPTDFKGKSRGVVGVTVTAYRGGEFFLASPARALDPRRPERGVAFGARVEGESLDILLQGSEGSAFAGGRLVAAARVR